LLSMYPGKPTRRSSPHWEHDLFDDVERPNNNIWHMSHINLAQQILDTSSLNDYKTSKILHHHDLRPGKASLSKPIETLAADQKLLT
ncbi:hypothetical protein L9F63_025171, partial [Diploptera punctata]